MLMSSRSAGRGAFVFIFIAVLVDSIGFGIILPVLPRLIIELTGVGMDRAAVYGGWLSFVYALMQFFCAPVLGNLSDRFGRRPVLLAALLALGCDYLIMGFAPAIGWLFAGWQIAHQVLPSTWAFYTISKFHWTSAEVGYSLAFVGLLMALAQGALTRVLIPWLGGARRAAAAGMAAAIIAYVGYAFATEGWMMCVVALTTFVFAPTYPSMNALASPAIPADAQGELQGAVAGLYSLSSIVGPPLMTQVFGHFSARSAGFYFPGAAFLTAALLTAGCAALFARALRRLAPQETGAGRLPNLTP